MSNRNNDVYSVLVTKGNSAILAKGNAVEDLDPGQLGFFDPEAIKTLARSEGLIVDHIYTGKAFAGLLDLSKKEYFGDKNVIFLHTGGSPALFDLDPDLL